MKAYINIFLTLVMPLSIVFAAIAIVYFSMSFDFSKAIKLGILAGVLSSVAFSFIMAFIILIARVLRQYQFKKQIKKETYKKMDIPIKQDPTLYEKKSQSTKTSAKPKPSINHDTVVETFMLLMDKDIAYEVALSAIRDENISDVLEKNEKKKEKSIQLQTKEEEIHIKLSSLTKHTTQVFISSTLNKDNIRKIITVLKEKEHSFMQY